MITNTTLTLATANLFNFIEPPNAFYDFENIYDTQAWHAKCEWTKKQILELDADIIGLQEVFSIEAAEKLVTELGYSHFATVAIPHIESDYIHSQPVVAVASKFPFKHVEPVTSSSLIAQHYSIEPPSFSRPPIFAVIDVPDVGDIAFYVCHLKSQRPTQSDSEQYSHPIIGQWLSTQQRGWEAVMLRLFMEMKYQTHPMPTILVGDMNQSLAHHVTGLLTHPVDQSLTALNLQDSWDIFTLNEPLRARPATQYHFAQGNVLDYILVSQEFQPNSPHSLADVKQYQVQDKHLINPNYEQDKQASDHAFVAVTVQFVL
ncbi:endonuclease [Vibrio panuliri]|uniref:Endonuclease n=1 Tax=Vibrio panuliri TaxID=1381081 RepID=A0A1Q9HR37_9VIBR|nr:endonuclease/exonuclease/phosphatase family protein [Vibrio panuliri]OLQ93344.1 endonuclease [Vibrio panuliri]